MFWINWPFGGKDVTSSPTPSRNCLVTRRDMKKSGLPFYNRNLSHALFSEELFTLFSSASTTPCSFDLHNYPVQQSCSQTICYGFVPNIPAWLNQTNSIIESTLFFFLRSYSTPLPPLAEGITGLKELAFLRDLAEQNSLKYGVDRTSDRDRSSGSAGATVMPVVKGSMMVLNQLSNLETTVGRFYINLPNRMIDLARFSLPYTDPMGDGE